MPYQADVTAIKIWLNPEGLVVSHRAWVGYPTSSVQGCC